MVRKLTPTGSSNPTPQSKKSSVITKAKEAIRKQHLPKSPPREEFEIVDMTMDDKYDQAGGYSSKKSSIVNCSNRASYHDFLNILSGGDKGGLSPLPGRISNVKKS